MLKVKDKLENTPKKASSRKEWLDLVGSILIEDKKLIQVPK
ncbi:MAG: hypothetical protein ACRC6T_01600 [Sarcina sp.]